MFVTHDISWVRVIKMAQNLLFLEIPDVHYRTDEILPLQSIQRHVTLFDSAVHLHFFWDICLDLQSNSSWGGHQDLLLNYFTPYILQAMSPSIHYLFNSLNVITLCIGLILLLFQMSQVHKTFFFRSCFLNIFNLFFFLLTNKTTFNTCRNNMNK
jgi:hypothetical protein